MNCKVLVLFFLFVLVSVTGVSAQTSLDSLIDKEIASLVATYERLHASPELSHHEEKTAAFLANELKSMGYAVEERIGKFDRPEWTGYGLAATLRNGRGPTVLVRTDLDALPIEENTGLPYSSKVKTKNDAGQEVSVMHACGHDIHISSLLGTAKMLVQLKSQWKGTLILVGQPAEETVDGARAMLKDGLYTRFPKPDFALALHDSPQLDAGKIGYCPGYAMASATSVDLLIRGLGGHGSKPEATKDPIVVAAEVILAIQTIVSRENSPLDPAVVTVGSIHGGTKHNIIPDEVKLQLTVRAYDEAVRQKILAAIQRIAKNIALAAGIPEDRAPIMKVNDNEVAPPTFNDPGLTQRLASAFERTLGKENVVKVPPVMGSEDFGRFGLEDHQIPICLFWLGAVDPLKIAESKQTGIPLPFLHSSRFAPLPEPTIKTGIKAMTSAVLELMKK